jgi:hypothetical protein
MAIIKLEEICLYTSDIGTNAAEMVQAQAFMDHSGIPYTRLMYNNQQQHDDVIKIVNTWWTGDRTAKPMPPVTDYPFLTYTEVHDDIAARFSPITYLQGIDAIKTFPEIYTSIMGQIANNTSNTSPAA